MSGGGAYSVVNFDDRDKYSLAGSGPGYDPVEARGPHLTTGWVVSFTGREQTVGRTDFPVWAICAGHDRPPTIATGHTARAA